MKKNHSFARRLVPFFPLCFLPLLAGCASLPTTINVGQAYEGQNDLADNQTAFVVLTKWLRLTTFDGKPMSLEQINAGSWYEYELYYSALRALPGAHSLTCDFEARYEVGDTENTYTAKNLNVNLNLQPGMVYIIKARMQSNDSVLTEVESGPLRLKSPDNNREISFDVRQRTINVTEAGQVRQYAFLPEYIKFSPDGRRLAFCTETPAQWQKSKDGKLFPVFDYRVTDDWFYVLDGAESTDRFTGLPGSNYSPCFDRNGRHWAIAFSVRHGVAFDLTWKRLWVVDGVKMPEHDEISVFARPFFNAQNQFVYAARDGEKKLIVAGDKEISEAATWDEVYKTMEKLAGGQ